jgi:hypothetical protein
MCRLRYGCALVLAAAVTDATAAEETPEAPDLEFLEYLGSWQRADEEWFIDAELRAEEEESQQDEKAGRRQNRREAKRR